MSRIDDAQIQLTEPHEFACPLLEKSGNRFLHDTISRIISLSPSNETLREAQPFSGVGRTSELSGGEEAECLEKQV